MNLPGARFRAEQRVLKEFEGQDRSFRDLVFYSEGPGDWPHMGPVILSLLNDHDRRISYISSDENDPGLAVDHPQLRAFNIGSGTARTILFARLDCRHMVMTMPDLGNLWLKRSVHSVHYVYMFHSMNSTHTSYRKGAFDNYDTILCVGPHHVAEIRKAEEVYGLPAKKLIEHGSVKLDSVVAEFAEAPPAARSDGPREVLIAPTWGESSLIEQPTGHEIIEVLLGAGIRTVLRLHPMTVRRLPDLVRSIDRAFGSAALFRLEDDMSATESWLRSDLMISDWSGAATEYALALLKPVIYIDTPQKLLNGAYGEFGIDSFEARIRTGIGTVTRLPSVGSIVEMIEDVLQNNGRVAERLAATRGSWIFNLGNSAAVGASYLASRRDL